VKGILRCHSVATVLPYSRLMGS